MKQVFEKCIRTACLSLACVSVFLLFASSAIGKDAVIYASVGLDDPTGQENLSSDTDRDTASVSSGLGNLTSVESETVSDDPSVPSAPQTPSSDSTPQSSSEVSSEESYTLTAEYAGLFDAATLTPIYLKSADKKIAPASLTKLITACTALRYASLKDEYTVGTELSLVKSGSSLSNIKKGQSFTLYELLCGMLISSGNDAAYTVAVNVARSILDNPEMSDSEAVNLFVALMNKYAKEIGALNTNFTNPDGWDNKKQLTTVNDLAIIAAHAMTVSPIKEIVATPQMVKKFSSGKSLTWKNTNLLLQKDSEFYLPEATGMKTGSTDSAGRCLIATLTVDGKEYISIVAGCSSDKKRYTSTLALIEMINQEEPEEEKQESSPSSDTSHK